MILYYQFFNTKLLDIMYYIDIIFLLFYNILLHQYQYQYQYQLIP
jgi:hypothetical protein